MTRSLLVVAFALSIGVTAPARAQAPAPAQPPQPQPSAATAPQARAPRSAAVGRPVNVTVSVTDGRGLGVADTHVTLSGPVTREGATVADGSFRALGLKPGEYRFRFERERYITLERDVTVRNGQPTEVDVMLSRALEAPKPEPPSPAPPPPAAGRTSAPLPAATFDVTAYLEKDYLKSGPNRVKSISCSDTDAVTLVQTTTSYAAAAGKRQLVAVAIAGQGRVSAGGRSSVIDSRSGTTLVIPENTGFEATREGKGTLIFVLVTVGEGCRAGETAAR